MALSSNPGAYDLLPNGRKRWLLPFAFASLALVGMTLIAFYFAFRTSGPVQVVSATPAPSAVPAPPVASTATLTPADTAVIALDDVGEIPASPATMEPPKAPAAPGATTVAAKPYQPSSSVPVTAKKPAASRKDVYKPF